MRAKELREEARNCLQGKWQKAIVIAIIYAAITWCLSLLSGYVSSIFSIVSFVIMPAITYGMAYSWYHLKKGDEVGYADFLTIGFKNFKRAWGVAWGIFCKTWWCIFLIIIPIIEIAMLGVGMFSVLALGTTNSSSEIGTSAAITKSSYSYYDSYYYDDNDYYLDDEKTEELVALMVASLASISAGVVAIFAILTIVWFVILILYIVKLLLYVYAYYVAVINENLTPKEAILESRKMMEGNRGRYVCLILSFIGWSFLAGFVTGLVSLLNIGILTSLVSEIGMVILTPYMSFSIVSLYEDLQKSLTNN